MGVARSERKRRDGERVSGEGGGRHLGDEAGDGGVHAGELGVGADVGVVHVDDVGPAQEGNALRGAWRFNTLG